MNLPSPFALRAAVLLAVFSLTSHAAPFQFSNGDLILGIQASSGTGSTKNLFLNLGPAVNYRDNGDIGQIADIGTTLASVYGADWYDRNDLHFGVVGNLNAKPPSGFGSTPPVNGDPSRTFYISLPTTSPGAAIPIPEGTYVSAALGSAGTKLSGMEQMLLGSEETPGLEQNPDGTGILDQGLHPVQWYNGWTAWNPVPGAAFDIFTGGIQQSFGKGGDATYVDLQRILASNAGAEPEGIVGGSTYLTTISISRTGMVTAFTPEPDQPELDLTRSDGSPLNHGSSSVSFTPTAMGQSSAPATIVIKSVGTGALNISSVSLVGDHPGDFVINGPSTLEFPPGAQDILTIQFTPTQEGIRTAVLRIESNDADENPFDIQIDGTAFVASPEIEVEQPEGTSLVSGEASLDLGDDVVLGGSGDDFTFVIRNAGTSDLTGIAVSIAGTHPGDFAVTQPAASTLAPSASATFMVRFLPQALGTRNAEILVSSNDSDENPFRIGIRGTGLDPVPRLPEIEIRRLDGTQLVSGQTNLNAGQVLVGQSGPPMEFTVWNTGDGRLTGLALSVSGGMPGDFIASGLNVDSLEPGQSTTFRVVFRPTVPGGRTALVEIASNAPDENPYELAFTGNGIRPVPEIVVKRERGSILVDGSKLKFGRALLGKATARRVTVWNTGTAQLKGLKLKKTGPHAKDFKLIKPSSPSVAPGKKRTFYVIFKPVSKGTRNAGLRILSNDEDEGRFYLKMSGKADEP